MRNEAGRAWDPTENVDRLQHVIVNEERQAKAAATITHGRRGRSQQISNDNDKIETASERACAHLGCECESESQLKSLLLHCVFLS